MIKTFILTMVFGSYGYGGGVATVEYPVYEDCKAAAEVFVKTTKDLATVTDAKAWCTTKNTPETKK
ncbi:hypothetical protein QPL51_04260 [Escherichia coli]|uniref:hypothetical protein n=1 Tax=Escherichia coli TaxID=562 RepID=UPI002879B1B0|nr:hypothetical protein [Escherichia coli]MDS1552249.1 hypothetical protein [Escherichia coli]